MTVIFMLDLTKLKYDVVAVTADGKQLNLTDITSHLGWEEGEKELSAHISLQLANITYQDKRISDYIQPFTPIFIYSFINGESVEVIRGTVAKWSWLETNKEIYLNIDAYDEVQALRKNQDEFFFTDGHSTKAIVTKILDKWQVPYDYKACDVKHSKKAFKKKYLCDMIIETLKDAKELGGGTFFMRAKEGKIEIIPRGTNETIFHFDLADNIFKTDESFDISNIVTRVLIVGQDTPKGSGKKSKKKKSQGGSGEGHQKIEATIDGRTDLGIRQVIYERPNKTTLEEAEKAAKKILEEQGQVKRKTVVESPDIPTLRKGDRVRAKSSTGEGYFFVKSVRHNAAAMKMTMELDEDKDYNKEKGIEYDTSQNDGARGSDPP